MPQTTCLAVAGMTCADCSARIEATLAGLSGVSSFSVSLLSGKAKVTFDEVALSESIIVDKISVLGFSVQAVPDSGSSAHVDFLLTSSKVGEDGPIASYLQTVAGVQAASTRNLEADRRSGIFRALSFVMKTSASANSSSSHVLSVIYDPSMIGARDVLALAQKHASRQGCAATLQLCPAHLSLKNSAADEAAAATMRLRVITAVLAGVPSAILAYAIPHVHGGAYDGEDSGAAASSHGVTGALDVPLGGAELLTPRVICQWLLATLILGVIGPPLGSSAWAAIRHSRMLTMDALVLSAATLAYAYSVAAVIISGAGADDLASEPVFESTCILLSLVAAGRWVEHAAKSSTAATLQALKRRLDGLEGGDHAVSWRVQPLEAASPLESSCGSGTTDSCCSSTSASVGDSCCSTKSAGAGDSCCSPAKGEGCSAAPSTAAAKGDSCCAPAKGEGCSAAPSTAAAKGDSCCAPGAADCCSDGPAGPPASWSPAPGEAVQVTATPVPLLQLGDVVVVPLGAVFPADGTVVDAPAPAELPTAENNDTASPKPLTVTLASGSDSAVGTAADEAVVTGEAVPVPKGPGAHVIGGSVNVGRTVLVRLTALPSTGTVARVMTLIDDAQGSRPAVQLAADRVASWFTPLVYAVAAASFICWAALGSAGLADTRGAPPAAYGIQFAITLLIVSCPCAISLAVPTAVYVGTQVAATRCGALVKGGPALERLAGVKHVIFDKTGTLTEGRPALTAVRLLVPDRVALAAATSVGVTNVSTSMGGTATATSEATAVAVKGTSDVAVTNLSKAQAGVLAAAALAEAGSEHPLATAVLETAAALVKYAFKPPAPGPKHPQASAEQAAPLEPTRTWVPGHGVVMTLSTQPKDAPAPAQAGGCGGGGKPRPSATATSSSSSSPAPSSVEIRVGSVPWLTSGTDAAAVEDDDELSESLAELEAGGGSVVGVALQGSLVALLSCRDAVRPDAAATVGALAARGVCVWLASGDGATAVAAVAAAVGIPAERSFSRQTPEGKARLVARVRDGTALAGSTTPPQTLLGKALAGDEEAGAAGAASAATPAHPAPPAPGPVLMVGDGVNDGVALAAADVGVALGSGTAVAMDTADVVLRRHSGSPRYLAGLLDVLRLSRDVQARIRWNFLWAFVYNILAMPLAAGVFTPANGAASIPPGLAGASEIISSVPVVLGSLLLYRFRASGA